MKKILEVVQYEDHNIRFSTDIDVVRHPEEVELVLQEVIFEMATKLWGGQETSVMAIIRAMAIADLALISDRESMLEDLADAAEDMWEVFQETLTEMSKMEGVSIQTYGPGVPPPKAN